MAGRVHVDHAQLLWASGPECAVLGRARRSGIDVVLRSICLAVASWKVERGPCLAQHTGPFAVDRSGPGKQGSCAWLIDERSHLMLGECVHVAGPTLL